MSDLGTFSIRIVDKEGNGVPNVEVECRYYTIPASWHGEYTNEDGWAEFEIAGEYGGSTPAQIAGVRVKGEVVSDEWWRPEDGDTKSFTLPGDGDDGDNGDDDD